MLQTQGVPGEPTIATAAVPALRSPSRTAVLTAVARALHLEQPPPTVLNDPFALPLAGEEGAGLMKRLKIDAPGEALLAFCRWICVRARMTEEVVEGAAGEGFRQYVILGAGLDSFAYRRPDLLDRLRVYEVDHPASQAWKQDRLVELGVARPANLVYAPVDFETQTLREGLQTAGFDFGAPAVFSWIGVTVYLTLAAIEATLETVATCIAGTASCSPTTSLRRLFASWVWRPGTGLPESPPRWASLSSPCSSLMKPRHWCAAQASTKSSSSARSMRSKPISRDVTTFGCTPLSG